MVGLRFSIIYREMIKNMRGDKNPMKKGMFGRYLLVFLAVFSLCVTGCDQSVFTGQEETGGVSVSMEELPEYQGEPYVTIDGNKPGFIGEELPEKSFERYGRLDSLGRCSTAYANIGPLKTVINGTHNKTLY